MAQLSLLSMGGVHEQKSRNSPGSVKEQTTDIAGSNAGTLKVASPDPSGADAATG